jgi:hypothetical protein
MGYRSDVTLVFYTLPNSGIPFGSLKLWFDENFSKLSLAKYGQTSMGNDWIKVHWDSIKWYEGYDEVKEVDAAIELFGETFRANDENTQVAWECIRLGEDIADIDLEGSIYQTYRLGVTRETTFD